MDNTATPPLLALQNGSDIRGVALPGEHGQPVNLTPQVVFSIGKAFALWLSQKTGVALSSLRIGIGRDSRISGPALLQSALQGLRDTGASAWDCSLASTPAMFMSTQIPQSGFHGAIMVTASHLPAHRNGLKFFTAQGSLGKGDIRALLDAAGSIVPPENIQARDPHHTVLWSDPSGDSLMELYCRLLREKIRKDAGDLSRPLSGMHIVVDAGNGAGGFFVQNVLKPLGADTSGSRFLEPDGRFPNHVPNPEDPLAMQSIRDAVLENDADLGIIFDTDVDRMSAVLPGGLPLNRDGIIAMMSAIAAKDDPGSTIVTDSVTSHTLTAFLENILGLHHRRFKRGYKNVIDECRRLNDAGISSPLAIETSGHGAFRENHFLDDGAYMAVKLVSTAARLQARNLTLAHLLKGYAPAHESREYRLPLSGSDFRQDGEMILSQLRSSAGANGITVDENNVEGVRLLFLNNDASGWALLRLSLHDPLMPLNLEGDGEGHCQRIVTILRRLLSPFSMLDTSSLQ